MSQTLSNLGATLNDTDFSKFPVFVPESMRFKPTRKGLAARRTPVKIRAEQGEYSTTKNRLIRFVMPNNALYDTRSGYITADITISNATGTYVRIHQGVFSIFQRLRILVSSTEVEDLRDYNRLYSFLWEMINPSLVTGNMGLVMGFGTQAERNAKGAAVTSYCVPLYSGVLNTELLPFDNLASGMVLELYLDDATKCLESDSPTIPVITVSNLIFHMERLDVQDDYRQFIKAYVSSNGLQLGFPTWERLINSLTGGLNQNLTIQHKSSSVNGMLNFFFDSGKFNDMSVNDKFLSWDPLSLVSGSLLMNGTVFPDEPVDTVTCSRLEAYQMYCRWLIKWKLSGFISVAPPISIQNFAVNRFVLIDDFEPYPEVTDIINPFTTLGNSASIVKKLVFSGAVPANTQLDTWVEFFRQIQIYSNGTIQVLQ